MSVRNVGGVRPRDHGSALPAKRTARIGSWFFENAAARFFVASPSAMAQALLRMTVNKTCKAATIHDWEAKKYVKVD